MALNCTLAEIATNLCIDQSTVKQTIDLFEMTGDVCKQSYPKHRLLRVLSPTAEVILLTTFNNLELSLEKCRPS